jgi:8-oxo-dGTP pyrophosphatase MutT (NUDIX family)
MNRVWKPNVTVAAVVERDGRFLLVEEQTEDGIRLNQPAGHLENGESLLAAVVREALEESAYTIEPSHLLGIYRWREPGPGRTYLRFAFAAKILAHAPERRLDTGIIRALWLDYLGVTAAAAQHRSPLVQRCIEDYRAGIRYPLDLLLDYD